MFTATKNKEHPQLNLLSLRPYVCVPPLTGGSKQTWVWSDSGLGLNSSTCPQISKLCLYDITSETVQKQGLIKGAVQSLWRSACILITRNPVAQSELCNMMMRTLNSTPVSSSGGGYDLLWAVCLCRASCGLITVFWIWFMQCTMSEGILVNSI